MVHRYLLLTLNCIYSNRRASMKRIKKFTDYINIVNNISNSLKKDYIIDDVLLFRGHSDSKFKLLPGIARSINDDKDSVPVIEPILKFEKEMITKAIGKNPEIFYEDKYAVNLLVKLQHFGVPTRLLDVTYNALVALYFACIKDKDKDGEVIVFKITSDNGDYIKYFDDRYVNTIANMYKISQYNNKYSLKNYLKDVWSKLCDFEFDEETGGVSYGYREDIDNIANNINKPLFVSPIELSERQKRQQGAFIIFPNEISKINDTYFIDPKINEISMCDRFIVERIQIPKKLKGDTLKYLRFLYKGIIIKHNKNRANLH